MKRLISLLLAVTLVLSLFSGLSLSANATGSYEISFDKESYYVGESVWVTVTGTNISDKDWVALYAPGDVIPDTPSIAWQYMPSINGKAVDFRNDSAGDLDWKTNNRTEWWSFPAGTYRVVVFDNDSYNIITEASYTIEDAPVVGNPAVTFSFDKESYEVGDTVAMTIESSDIPSGSWWGVFAPGVTDKSYGWDWLEGNVNQTVNLVPGNDAVNTWNRTDAFAPGTYTVKLYGPADQVYGENTFTVNAPAGQPEPSYQLSLSKDGENPTYYICQGEDPTFTINAENFGDTDWIAIHCADETPGGSLPSIKYAYIKDINGQAVNIRDDSSVWYDSPTRIGHKELPATDYTIYVCLNDGYSVAESISFKVRDHKPETLPAVEPTCEEYGLTAGAKCELCKAVITAQEEVPALGHDWGEWTVVDDAVKPSCTETGLTAVEKKECSRCDAYETRGGEEVAALGHSYEPVVTQPTCTEQGYTTYTCSACQDSYVSDYTNALGHDWGEWTINTPATCTALGEKQRVCSRDASHIEKEDIPKADHKPVVAEEGFEPTCKTQGLTDLIICSECEAVLQEQTPIKPLGHNWGEWTVSKEATCGEAGEEIRVCANDKNHKETREIAATGNHNFGLVVTTTATTERNGKVESKCLVCGARQGEYETPIIVPQIGKITLEKNSYTFDNTAKKPAVVVKDINSNDINSKYYTVKYENNNKVGTAKAVITFTDRYEGVVTLNFSIALAKPTLKVYKVSQSAVALKWNKVAGAKFYRIYAYNTKTGKYTTVVKSTTATSCTIKKLAAGTTYYYLVRAFVNESTASAYAKTDNVKAITLCKAPTVKTSVKKKAVTLKWAKVTGAKFYTLYKYNTKTKKYTTILKKTTKLTATFKSQPKGKNYYLVRAFNANSQGSAYTTSNHIKAVVK